MSDAADAHTDAVPEQEPEDMEEQETESVRDEEPKEVHVPKYRESYPLVLLLAVEGAALLALWPIVVAFKMAKRDVAIAVLSVTCVVALWWHDVNRTLRDRRPPPGWKSQIMPDRKVFLTDDDFDSMRFELEGDDDEDIEDHRVRWVTRFSKDIFALMWLLAALAVVCPFGAFFWPEVSLPGSSNSLSNALDIRWMWPAFTPLLLLVIGLLRLEWNYARLMVTDSQIYDLRENPAWMPWLKGKNNPIPLTIIRSADPVDTEWGKRWGHGTVALKIETGYGNWRTIYFRRVPNHRKFCNAVNGMLREYHQYGGEPRYY